VQAAALADLPATTAEVATMVKVMEDFDPAEMRGVCALQELLTELKQRVDALGASSQQQEQQEQPEGEGASKRRRAATASAANDGSSSGGGGEGAAVHPPAEAASSAAARVHGRLDLLQHIMSLVGKGEWAYIAPVSRMARAAYMAAMFDTPSGIPNICRTDAAAAAQSTSRLNMALASGDGAAVVRAQLEQLSGDVREWSVTQRLQQLGMAVGHRTLLAAARAGSLLSLQRVKQCMVEAGAPPTAHIWQDVGAAMADCGAGAAPLTWLSQQQDKWPVWFSTVLCHWAASGGHLETLRFLLDPEGGQAVFGDVVLDVTAEQLETGMGGSCMCRVDVLSLCAVAHGQRSSRRPCGYAPVAARGARRAAHAIHRGVCSRQRPAACAALAASCRRSTGRAERGGAAHAVCADTQAAAAAAAVAARAPHPMAKQSGRSLRSDRLA
jgi:hypothetical protein